MAKFINFTTPVNLKNYTFVIPSISVGNVPQLAVDLIISTHNLQNIGTVWHPAIVPTVGGDPYGSDPLKISVACEIYANSDLKLAVLQIRSGIDLKYALKFFQALKDAVTELGISNVLLLASTFAYEQHDINSGHFRYISNQNVTEEFKKSNVKPMEKDDTGRYVLHGAGVVLKMFEVFGDAVNCTVIIKYVSEGDNRPDAVSVLGLLYRHVKCISGSNVGNIQFPKSWSHVFGNPPPLGIY